jgi:SAGA-associated factor 29
MYTSPDTIETIGKVNRLISVWPTDDTVPVDGIESVKTNHRKLSSALNEIRTTAEKEIK